MSSFIASKVIKLMIKKGIKINGARILILGVTFKENCPDIRNTKVVDVKKELDTYNTFVDVYDPHANKEEVKKNYNINLINTLNLSCYQAIILCVSHDEFKQLNFKKLDHNKIVIYDTKGFIQPEYIDGRL